MFEETTTETTFGTVRRNLSETTISADGDTLRDWARRGDCRWPCSDLAKLDRIEVTFDSRGDLVDIIGDENVELSADELNAWSSETLIRAGWLNHPAIR